MILMMTYLLKYKILKNKKIKLIIKKNIKN